MKTNEVAQEEFEVVKQAGHEVTVAKEASLDEWGVPTMTASDLTIPKILLMQGTSEEVTEGKRIMGDIVLTSKEEKIGDVEHSVPILPFFCRKIYMVYTIKKEKNKTVSKFLKIEDDKGQNYPFEGVDPEHGAVRYFQTYQFFGLLEGETIPATFIFKSTAHKVGKQLFTLMYGQNLKAGLTPASYWINYGCRREKGEESTYIVPVVTASRKSTQEEINECLEWIKVVRQVNVKFDDVEKPQTVATGPAQF